VGGAETRRYSGSPLAMGFGEARQEKSLCLVAWDKENGGRPRSQVRLIPIPVFQPIERIQGDWDRLAERLQALVAARSSTWIEVIYEGEAVISDLRERLDALLAITEETSPRPEILRVRNNRIVQGVLEQMHEEESLGDLDELEVFARCLESQGVVAEQKADLLRAYQEILASFHHGDPLAE
jgi:exonuclease SbcD